MSPGSLTPLSQTPGLPRETVAAGELFMGEDLMVQINVVIGACSGVCSFSDGGQQLILSLVPVLGRKGRIVKCGDL